MAKGKTQKYYDNNPEAKKKKAAYDKKYNAKPEQKKNRSSRNQARKKAIMNGKISPGSDKDINHKNGNPRDNSSGNLQAESKKKNRGRK